MEIPTLFQVFIVGMVQGWKRVETVLSWREIGRRFHPYSSCKRIVLYSINLYYWAGLGAAYMRQASLVKRLTHKAESPIS